MTDIALHCKKELAPWPVAVDEKKPSCCRQYGMVLATKDTRSQRREGKLMSSGQRTFHIALLCFALHHETIASWTHDFISTVQVLP